ncbi:hypothetical protein GLOIN_2v1597449 [Rhizophagus irregularis DAOM 181602=DAOM 197198]|uniref:Uncharacterized protein n=1 Tax=Rhizophagus irregularis (strain DAOM 181602 / DAOM 197198 / MUCL 43194) TaxID=747089 RepID=A0A2P4Q3U0_RHIID|nr:hypothetical protein GLOIN_2v1597449 [Rhizophagus irregularis DAOM 181602=DAOM 197198]POG72300.1 hypothetical protein GLOIN_2v1597449 [Rhizophagus irregularis DAOM 181602=DAOM 197198]|eukprot:XP_025179166.1 hypothetical protein GLOIN_2v1597449 [Rhizophagus irregularis DAOM 181602=DAOM 197198]
MYYHLAFVNLHMNYQTFLSFFLHFKIISPAVKKKFKYRVLFLDSICGAVFQVSNVKNVKIFL